MEQLGYLAIFPSLPFRGGSGRGLLLHKLGSVHLPIVGLDSLGHNDRSSVALLDGLCRGGDGARYVAAGQARHRNQCQEKQDGDYLPLLVIHVKHHIIYDLIIYNLFIYLAI